MCYICSKQLQDLDVAIKHLQLHGVRDGEMIKCMKMQISHNLFCKTSFQTVKALKKHLSENKCIVLCNDVGTDTEILHEFYLVNEFSKICVEEISSDKKRILDENASCFKNFAVFLETFIEKLNSHNLQHNVLNDILALSKELVSKTTEINKHLTRNNSKEETEFILVSTNDFVSSHIDTFKSRYKRNLQYEGSQYFVVPERLDVGSPDIIVLRTNFENVK